MHPCYFWIIYSCACRWYFCELRRTYSTRVELFCMSQKTWQEFVLHLSQFYSEILHFWFFTIKINFCMQIKVDVKLWYAFWEDLKKFMHKVELKNYLLKNISKTKWAFQCRSIVYAILNIFLVLNLSWKLNHDDWSLVICNLISIFCSFHDFERLHFWIRSKKWQIIIHTVQLYVVNCSKWIQCSNYKEINWCIINIQLDYETM